VRKRTPLYLLCLVLLLLVLYFLRIAGPVGADSFDRTAGPLIFTRHAKCRMICRQIDQSEVEDILKNGKINMSKSEPNDKPDPKYALEGSTKDGQQVRIIFAMSKRGVVVITVIDLNKEWACDCK